MERSPTTAQRRRAAAAAAALAASAAGRATWEQARALRDVPPELRRAAMLVSFVLPPPPLLALVSSLPVPAAPVVDGVVVERRSVPGAGGRDPVEVWVYEPVGRTRPSGALLWMHGGGYVLGHPVMDHGTCSRVARDLGVLVVSVRYSLAPARPFPAGLDDARGVLRWLQERSGDLGVDPRRVAVGGESAGGGLAAALAQQARDTGSPVAFQLLVYPMLDDRTALDRGRSRTLVWTPQSNRVAWGAYLGHPVEDGEDRPYAVAARREDLSGLPPAWIGVGTPDLFRDEDVAYAHRLEAAGVPCRLEVVPGMYHGAWSLAADAPPVAALRESATRALGRALGAPTSAG
ncbi:alpha/beta hydrolase [uncultured Pseudokineococcus sp.]|uniref:alpha/beta hydrolase n=1 Tax=uncultured Pseudokineococcus sp. TaxID=1642928 RepID=UPI00262DB667|nr:alpha/beta hydrolase [uncultured Pseudokineococcus sp.]